MWRALVSSMLLTSLSADVTSGPIDGQATEETKRLYKLLLSVAGNNSSILVGKQLPTLFGLYGGHPPYWVNEYHGKQQTWMFNPAMAHAKHADELCDPCALTHDFPAVTGFDLTPMLGSDMEDACVYLLHRAEQRGAIITMHYHPDNLVTGGGAHVKGDHGVKHSIQRILPGGDHQQAFQTKLDQIADLVKRRLVDKSGRPIPIIFRPWHEANANWFWWGSGNAAQNTPDDIKTLYRFTVAYLKNQKGVHSFLYAFSPDCGGKMHEATIYPGNDYVDIIGTDCYLTPSREADTIRTAVSKTVRFAAFNKKIAALTETGVLQEDLTKRPHFFTQDILHSLTSSSGMRMAYMMTWNNQRYSNGQYAVYDPFPGHPSAHDYMVFYNDSRTFFLKDLRQHHPDFYN